MAMINSIDEGTGNILEPYELKLMKFMFWGLYSFEVWKRINLPRGFNHEEEFIKGREFKP